MFIPPRPLGRPAPSARTAYYNALKRLLARLGLNDVPPAARDLLREYGHAALERDRLIADLEGARAAGDVRAAHVLGRALDRARLAVDRAEDRVVALVPRRDTEPDPLEALARLNADVALRAARRAERGAGERTGGSGEKRPVESVAGGDTHIAQVTEDNDDASA